MNYASELFSKVPTKSIKRVLAPIINQVSLLIILNEGTVPVHEVDPSEDEVTSPSLYSAIYLMIQAATRAAEVSKDERFKMDINIACSKLQRASQNVSNAADLEVTEETSQSNAVDVAKDILEATLEVLLVTDASEVQRIVEAVHLIKKRASLLSTVRSMNSLVECFKGFTESMMAVSCLVGKRQDELLDTGQRRLLLLEMSALRKFVPMISTAMKASVREPDNIAAQTSKSYVMGLLLSHAEDLISILKNRTHATKQDNTLSSTVTSGISSEGGCFVSSIDQILADLSKSMRYDLNIDNFAMLVETVVRDSMSVANMAAAQERAPIIHSCQRVLRHQSRISNFVATVVSNPSYSQLRRDYDDFCDQFCEHVQSLENNVNYAILNLVVDVLKVSTEPMEDLMKKVVKPALARDIRPNRLQCGKMLDPMLEVLDNHCDCVCQVARHVAKSSTDAKQYIIVLSCVKHLEELQPELYPAIVTCIQNPLNCGARQHLKLLKGQWCAELETLVDSIDTIVDTQMFIQESGNQLQWDVNECKQLEYIVDGDIKDTVTSRLVSRAKRVSQVATKAINSSEDPYFRNGLLVFVNRLDKEIEFVKSASNHLSRHEDDSRAYETLNSRCEIVVDCVQRINDAMKDDSTLPHILSPDRRTVRNDYRRCASDNELPTVKQSQGKNNYTEDIQIKGPHNTPVAQDTSTLAVTGEKTREVENHTTDVLDPKSTHSESDFIGLSPVMLANESQATATDLQYCDNCRKSVIPGENESKETQTVRINLKALSSSSLGTDSKRSEITRSKNLSSNDDATDVSSRLRLVSETVYGRGSTLEKSTVLSNSRTKAIPPTVHKQDTLPLYSKLPPLTTHKLHVTGQSLRASSFVTKSNNYQKPNAWELQAWEDSAKRLETLASGMGSLIQNMIAFTGRQPSYNLMNQSVTDTDILVCNAKSVAKNAEEIAKFAHVISEHCVDERCSMDLSVQCDVIPSLATQLRILSNVKAATPGDRTAEKVLVKNAQNLMVAVNSTVKAAEAACIKGLRQPEELKSDALQVFGLAMQWKHNLKQHRIVEANMADLDELGLRQIRQRSPCPGLTNSIGVDHYFIGR